MKKIIKILVCVVYIFQMSGCDLDKKSFIGTYYLFGGFSNRIILISDKEKDWENIIMNSYMNQNKPRKGVAEINYYKMLKFNNENFTLKEFDILTDSIKSEEIVGKWSLENNVLSIEDNHIGIYKAKYKVMKKVDNKVYLQKIDESFVIDNDKINIEASIKRTSN